jgi:G6PDH family F420-dependent oxidoreductase
MTKFGLTLSSEEHPPARLVELAVAAEASGFDFVSVSDHFHPWIEEQGHSPFVWSVLGAVAQATSEIEVGVGVSCPIMRMSPMVSAHAAATTACLLENRFVWGVGSGEALNEHIAGDRWPPADIRLRMLEEAIEVIRDLWTGESITWRGPFYTVEDARLFDIPDTPPQLLVSAFASESAQLAASHGDGLWTTGSNEEVLKSYREAGGEGPIWSQLTVCWDPDREDAIARAHRMWPNTGLTGQLAQDLRTVLDFEQATELVTPERIASQVPCGPDPDPILKRIEEMVGFGIDHVYLHQIGDPSKGFIDFWRDEIEPAVR